MIRKHIPALALAICFISSLIVIAQPAPEPEPVAQEVPGARPADAVEAAPLVVWNRTIFVYRSWREQFSPAQRAERARERIEALPEAGPWNIEATEAEVGDLHGIIVSVNGAPIIGILPTDLDEESGETLRQAADNAVAQLRAVLDARAAQDSFPLMMKAVGKSVAATVIFLLLLALTAKLRGVTAKRAWQRTAQVEAKIAGLDFRQQVERLVQTTVNAIFWAIALLFAYLWLVYVLGRFPYSTPWANSLGGYLEMLITRFGLAILAAMPNLFAVFLILMLARLAIRVINRFITQVEEGKFSAPWLHLETIQASRRLMVVIVWLFALTIAYPYVPGSSTDAFKGVSVFIGLMISLGSAGLVNQVMSGLVVVYSRAFRKNDYVRIGEKEGVVSEVGMLSTKLVTKRREEITIPNAVLVGTTSINYSRLAGPDGAIVAASVTIGYDAPWRQVHALLLLAASRSERIRQEPKPRVLQRELADHFVEYNLLFHVDRPEDRMFALSDIHAQIQDAFNEFGVQIMSPRFEMQPDGPVVVPKGSWYAAPASVSTNGKPAAEAAEAPIEPPSESDQVDS